MRWLCSRSLRCLCLAAPLFCARLWAQDGLQEKNEPPPEPWQIAGIRTAFADYREPYIEQSIAEQHEALKLCAEYHWGAALDAHEVAVYLASNDPAVRLAAVRILGQMGKEAGGFGKEVAALLSDQSVERRILYAAVEALERMGMHGAPVGKDVVTYLKDGNPDTRWWASTILSSMGPQGAQYATEIAKGFDDPVAGVRMGAITSVRTIGAGEAYALKIASLLGDPDKLVRIEAMYTVGKLAEGKEDKAAFENALAEMIKAANGHQSADLLRNVGKEGMPMGKVLAGFLLDDDASLRELAAMAFGQMARGAEAFAPALAELLHDENPSARAAAAAALGALAHEGAPTAKEIVPLLKDRDGEVRAAAAEALGAAGSEGAAFAGEVAAMLKDEDKRVRRRSATALSKMRASGAAFASDVSALLQDPEAEVRRGAVGALGAMGEMGGPYAGQVSLLLNDSRADVRRAAVSALGKIGPPGAAFVKEVVAILKGDDPNMLLTATRTLAGMSAEGAPVAADVAALLTESKIRTRWNAVITLGELGDAGAPFAKQVAAFLKDDGAAVRQDAVLALEKMHQEAAILAGEFAGSIGDPAFVSFFDRKGNPHGDLSLQAKWLGAVADLPAEKVPKLRAHLRFWSGGNATLQRSVTWLGQPVIDPMPKAGLSPAETQKTLELFLALWDHAADCAALRAEISRQIEKVAARITVKPDAETQKVLNDLAAKLKDQPAEAAADAAVEAALRKQDSAR